MTKTTLLCVVQWDDGDGPRIHTVGWDECPHQRDQMRDAAVKTLGMDPRWITAIRFMEVEIPLVEVDLSIPSTDVTVA